MIITFFNFVSDTLPPEFWQHSSSFPPDRSFTPQMVWPVTLLLYRIAFIIQAVQSALAIRIKKNASCWMIVRVSWYNIAG